MICLTVRYEIVDRKQHLQSAAVKIGLDLNLFRTLAKYDGAAASVEELSEKTGAEPLLLGNFCPVSTDLFPFDSSFQPRYFLIGLTHDIYRTQPGF
jgi:hypothetical protein